MPVLDATKTGVVDFRGHQTWYRVTGDIEASRGAGKSPLVVLHGGPGATHDYTLRMSMLSEGGRAVVHYDQLGCGQSTHLPDKGADFWTVQLFLDELDTCSAALDLADDYMVIGQSWGGMLGAEHAIRRPPGLRALVIADSPASMDLWVAEANRLRDDLPPDVQQTLLRHEADGTTDSAEYREAETVFYNRHVCRVVPNPPEVTKSFASIDEDPTVYHTMNGPSEFHVVGSLRDWTVVDRVHLIDAPTLVVSGAYDEATAGVVEPFLAAIPDVRWHVFPESSHMPHVEEEESFMTVVGDFLDSHDRPAATRGESDELGTRIKIAAVIAALTLGVAACTSNAPNPQASGTRCRVPPRRRNRAPVRRRRQRSRASTRAARCTSSRRRPAARIDPMVNYTLQYWQLYQAMYDGLLAFTKVSGQAVVHGRPRPCRRRCRRSPTAARPTPSRSARASSSPPARRSPRRRGRVVRRASSRCRARRPARSTTASSAPPHA